MRRLYKLFMKLFPMIAGLSCFVSASLRYLQDQPYELALILGILWLILAELDELKLCRSAEQVN